VANIYRSTFVCTYADGTLVEPSVDYQTDLSTGDSEPSASDLAGAIWSHVGAAFKACLNSHITVQRLLLSQRVIAPAIGLVGSHEVNEAGTYTTGTIVEPFGLVAIINRHTGAASRSSRGWLRMPNPGIAADVTGNTLTSSFTSQLQALGNVLDDTVDVGGFLGIGSVHAHPVVYSRTRHKRGLTPYTFNLTGCTVNPKWHWLRSRMSTP